ncbi:formylmethanofuran dehydrogenase, partial [Candidatus Bipolaricaulota bacterium]|nr:formylmethanofuran dehydrogenase [Candidatus Bipolaricaulota bacterium]
METLTIDPRTIDLDGLIGHGIHLHGHRGPFLIAGIRMGLLALELLDNSGYFGIEAESETGTVT